MSTPTTATATLPHYRRHHYPYQPAGTTTTSYLSNGLPPPHTHTHAHSHSHSHTHTTTNPILLSPSSSTARLPPPFPTPSTQYSPSTLNGDSHTLPPPSTNGLTPSSTSASSRPSYALGNTAAAAGVAAPAMATSNTSSQNQRPMRQRSREPDWNSFYKNGLPKEIIVIDDTPEPEAGTADPNQPSHHIVNGAANAYVNGNGNGSGPPAAAARPAAKKRKRDEEVVNIDRGHHYSQKYGTSHPSTPHMNGSASGSISTDRTTVQTAAATSLSSNSAYDYDVQLGNKRKRTRQQVANEAKRREVDLLGDAYISYKPPPHPPKKAGDVPVRVAHDRDHDKSIKVDDDDGHYIVVPDTNLTERYQMMKLLGQGTFGKVVQALDRRRNRPVAIKIIRSVQKYRDASRIELRVLATLKANDEENRNRCIHLRDCFDFRGHICIVMDLLGQSVFDFLKGNGFVPFPNSQIQSFARQLLTSVAFLHDLNLIHTDLKPENILLCDSTYQTFTYNRRIPASSTHTNRQASQRKVLLDTEIRLIDFGSATFQDEYHSSVVSTRHYRAPEIILGLGWSYPCDIWSIGCILVEFFTGDALFQTHDNLEHLAMMEAVVGSRVDTHLVQAVNKMATRNAGNPASKYFKRLKLDYPTPDTNRASKRFVKAMKHLDDIIPTTNPFMRDFLDLLKKIFVYDPARRITAKEALQHPWFKEPAQPDDGTEAGKIRAERMRIEAASMGNRRLPPIRS